MFVEQPVNGLRTAVEITARDRGGLSKLSMLPIPRLVKDHCDKFIGFDERGEPAHFVVVSPPSHPDVAAVAAERAGRARSALGQDLGRSVLVPWHVGTFEGTTFSVSQFCHPFSNNRWIRRWQRFRMVPMALDWIAAVAKRTARLLSESEVRSSFFEPLQALAASQTMHREVRDAAAAALGDLERGHWRPRSVLSHNDFWWGNLIQSPATAKVNNPAFVVIDWGGSSVEGHPVYDLIRLSMSVNVGSQALRSELMRHCETLGCDTSHSSHYLMSGLAFLGEHLGEWPAHLFARTALDCHRSLQDALQPPSGTARPRSVGQMLAQQRSSHG